MADFKLIARQVRKMRMELELAVTGRPTGTKSRAAVLEIAGQLLQVEGTAERAALDVEPIEGRRPLALV